MLFSNSALKKLYDFIDEAMFLGNSAQADLEKNMASSFHQKLKNDMYQK